jgi:hypothetical protein
MSLGECQFEPDEIAEGVGAILEGPEVDGERVTLGPDHDRLKRWRIDCSYWKPHYLSHYERLVDSGEREVLELGAAVTVPSALFYSALAMLGDAIVEYARRDKNWGTYRFFPPILFTAWSAFEAWLRIHSELFVATCSPPRAVAEMLLETKPVVKTNGEIGECPQRYPVMERYWQLLWFGCRIKYDRGSRVWQGATRAMRARDALIHYDVHEMPEITTEHLLDYLESILLLWIGPSGEASRTLFHSQFDYHGTLVALREYARDFEERPIWRRGEMPGGDQGARAVVPIPFDNIDERRFPGR